MILNTERIFRQVIKKFEVAGGHRIFGVVTETPFIQCARTQNSSNNNNNNNNNNNEKNKNKKNKNKNKKNNNNNI